MVGDGIIKVRRDIEMSGQGRYDRDGDTALASVLLLRNQRIDVRQFFCPSESFCPKPLYIMLGGDNAGLNYGPLHILCSTRRPERQPPVQTLRDAALFGIWKKKKKEKEMGERKETERDQ